MGKIQAAARRHHRPQLQRSPRLPHRSGSQHLRLGLESIRTCNEAGARQSLKTLPPKIVTEQKRLLHTRTFLYLAEVSSRPQRSAVKGPAVHHPCQQTRGKPPPPLFTPGAPRISSSPAPTGDRLCGSL